MEKMPGIVKNVSRITNIMFSVKDFVDFIFFIYFFRFIVSFEIRVNKETYSVQFSK